MSDKEKIAKLEKRIEELEKKHERIEAIGIWVESVKFPKSPEFPKFPEFLGLDEGTFERR